MDSKNDHYLWSRFSLGAGKDFFQIWVSSEIFLMAYTEPNFTYTAFQGYVITISNMYTIFIKLKAFNYIIQPNSIHM